MLNYIITTLAWFYQLALCLLICCFSLHLLVFSFPFNKRLSHFPNSSLITINLIDICYMRPLVSLTGLYLSVQSTRALIPN
jgi:hypothetical protein